MNSPQTVLKGILLPHIVGSGLDEAQSAPRYTGNNKPKIALLVDFLEICRKYPRFHICGAGGEKYTIRMPVKRQDS